MSHPRSLHEVLEVVADGFRLASEGGPDALRTGILALRSMLAAAEVPNRDAMPERLVSELAAAIAAAAPAIADATEPRIAPEAIYLGLSAASSFARLFGHTPADVAATADLPLAADRVDHAAILADELDAHFRRQRIEARGDVLRRSLAIRRALNAAPTGAALH